MTSWTKLSKLNCGNQKFFLLLTCQHERSCLDLMLSDGAKSWSGKFDDKDFTFWSVKTKLILADYKTQTMKALRGETVDGQGFEYDVKEERDGSAELIWKRVLEDADIKFQLGCVKLQPSHDQANSLSKMLDSSIELTMKLQNEIHLLTEERDRLTSERAVSLQQLEKCISIKEDTEKDLYSKFVVVINDKKAKIRELKHELEHLQNREDNSKVAVSTESTKTRKTCIVHSDDESEDGTTAPSGRTKADDSDLEYDTDDELKGSSFSAGGKSSHQETDAGSKRKGQEDVEQDDGLLLGDTEDDVSIVPKRSRKARHDAAKKTCSRPIIPVASPMEVQPGTSLRRLSSQKTYNRSAPHNLDVNNLIDDMD